MSSAKRAQNKHKKNWRAQAKLLDVLSNDIIYAQDQEKSKNFLAIGDRLFAIYRAAKGVAKEGPQGAPPIEMPVLIKM